MPSARRERKPLLVVLAVLLIIIGAGGAGLLVQRMNTKIDVIVVTQPVTQGTQFTAADLGEAQISSDSAVSYVLWSDLASVTRSFAAINIPAGTLLNEKLAASTDTLLQGRDEIGLSLKDGQMPDDLQVGQTVDIYSTATTTTGCPGQPGHTLATGATVLSIAAGKNDNGDTDVEVALADEFAGGVTCNSANGTAALATVPNNVGG